MWLLSGLVDPGDVRSDWREAFGMLGVRLVECDQSLGPDLLGGTEVHGGMGVHPNPRVAVFVVIGDEEAARNARASSSDPHQSGKPGRYFSVLTETGQAKLSLVRSALIETNDQALRDFSAGELDLLSADLVFTVASRTSTSKK